MCKEIDQLKAKLKTVKTNKEKKAIFEKIKQLKQDQCIAKN